MALEHLKHQPYGRTFKVIQDGQDTGQRVYKAFLGQKNVDLGGGDFVPYVWDELNQSIRYGNLVCEFDPDGFQVIREFGSVETLIDDQRFEVQYWDDPQWRVLDLWQIGLTVNQQEDYCIITRHLSDGIGNTLDVDFLFRPLEKVKTTFRLHVVDANLYRIRFQNTGIAGEVIEVPYIEAGVDLGVYKLIFDNIKFQWTTDEIVIHEGYTIEDQAGGKKLDIFLGDFDLPAGGDVIISPDTWGPTATLDADDGMEINDTSWMDDYGGTLGCGTLDSDISDVGLMWPVTDVNLPGATINAGTKITIDFAGVNGSGTQGILKIVDDDTPGVWGAGNRPSGLTKHPDTVEWDQDQSGVIDSPELNAFIQQRIDGADVDDPFASGDKIAIVWEDDGSGGSDNTAWWNEGDSDLTIVYTPDPGDYPVYEDNGGIATGADDYVDVPYPGTVNENDILLVCVLDADDDSFDVPAGWAKIDELTANSNASFAWYWKRATGSETGVERFTSVLSAGALVAGVMARYSNCTTEGTPYDETGGPTRNGVTQSTTINLGSVTTQGDNRLVVAMIGVEDNLGISQAANYTEDFEVTTDVGGDGSFSFQSQEVVSAGVVGAETATTGNDYWGTLVLGLIPAGAGQSYKKYINEISNLSENLFKAMGYKRLIFATEGLQEGISRNRTMIRYFAEIVDLVEIAVRKITMKRAINESIDIIEGIATKISTIIKQFINETIDLIETTYRKSALKRFISSTIDLTESIKPVRALKRIISEMVGLIESVKAVRSMKRILSSTLDITENLIRKISMTRTISESIDLIESISTAVAISIKKFINEVVDLVDSANTHISASLIKIINEVVSIIDSLNTHISALLKKIINETINIVESVSISISAELKRYINEVINLTETVLRKGSLKRILSETIDIFEDIVYPRALKRIISATVELIESARALRTMKRKLIATLSIIETIARPKIIIKIVNESISIIESIIKTTGAALELIYQDFRNVFTFDNLRRIFRIDK